MSIKQLANQINELAEKDNHPFSKIQGIRNNHGITPRTWKPFAEFSIKEDYAFHAGGRKEFQFNIGTDELNGETVFRYGIAFSLKQDKTLHDSKAEFKSKIENFNQFLIAQPEFFKELKMWYYANHHFEAYFDQVQLINEELFRTDNFIFIGKYIEKDIKDISEQDLKDILIFFDYLLPLYVSVQFGKELNEKRIARICWNDKGWVLPSGRYGKSKHVGSHEAKYGYGHEEWLFDTGKLIGGYKYGFLEPIRKQQGAYSQNVYDVWLYTIDGETKKRYWVGEINNVEVLDKEQAESIKNEYVNQRWLKEMEEQIRASGANPKGFSDWKGVDLFNIRFLPSDVKLNDPYFDIPEDNPVNKQTRYAFAFYKNEFNLSAGLEEDTFVFTPPTDDGEETNDNIVVKTYVRDPKAVEIAYLHKTISESLTKELRKKYGENNVTSEHKAGYGANRIDIVVQDKNELIFYEIKNYPTLKASIREAIGQLIEYSLWPNKLKAKQLVIVTQPHADVEKAKVYFKHLRDTYNLPLYYQSYDIGNKYLSDPV